jgi:hypothetical protein
VQFPRHAPAAGFTAADSFLTIDDLADVLLLDDFPSRSQGLSSDLPVLLFFINLGLQSTQQGAFIWEGERSHLLLERCEGVGRDRIE